MALQLLRGHIRRCPNDILCLRALHTLRQNSDAEIGQQQFVVSTQQDVLRFDIAVNQVLGVGILQGGFT